MRYNVYAQYIFQEPLKLAAIVILLLLGFGVLGAAWGWVLAIIAMSVLALLKGFGKEEVGCKINFEGS